MDQPEEIPPGGDAELNEAIKIMLATSGFETDEPEVIKLVELALRKRLEIITANTHFYAGSQDNEQSKVLMFEHLVHALNEDGIRIDRPPFILEQPQSKMSTRRSKTAK